MKIVGSHNFYARHWLIQFWCWNAHNFNARYAPTVLMLE